MKISKLFHWLYAILMLLPFAFFVPSVLYYAFNDNATMQTVEVSKTETIAVDFNQITLNGNCETSLNNWYSNSPDGTLTLSNNKCNYVCVDSGFAGAYANLEQGYPMKGHNYLFRAKIECEVALYCGLGNGGGSNNVSFVLNSGSDGFVERILSVTEDNLPASAFFIFFNTSGEFDVSKVNVFDLTQMFGSGNEPTIAEFNLMLPNDYYSYTESQPMQITYDTGETMQIVENTDIINYAWESIWNLPLFNWCKVSFVATPFTFITGLFGLAPSNSFNYVFTYFASMSIIWLVFDVVLYVPLLVHRWLDKGIVE